VRRVGLPACLTLPGSRQNSIAALGDALESEDLDLGAHSSPDGAVTLYFCDIEGSGALAERLGEHSWSEVLQNHDAIVRALAQAHEGEVVKALGDGFMFAFRSAHSGVRCAIEAQRAFADTTVPSTDEPLRVRIGLHSGFVIQEEEDFFGRNVVLGSRIADLAQGGEILVSTAVKDYVETDPSLELERHGEHHFKGVLGEHRVYSVSWR
jgi:class 3 adenylate cyclase